MHLPAARDQLMRQRLGRKQMAAGSAGGQQDRAALAIYSAGTARGGTRVKPDLRALFRSLARQRQHHAHRDGDGDLRGAAIGDERQRHALGRHQLQVDRHVDDRLEAEHDDQAGHRIAREIVMLLERDASARAAR